MKKSILWAMLAALLPLSAYCSHAVAQGHPGGAVQPASGPRLALIDVSYIFKNHVRFSGMMEDMKKDVQNAEQRVRADREDINKLIEDLRLYHKGTPDYKSREEEVTKRQADLAVKIQLQKNEFLQREAKIYYNVYQEIWQATNYICRQNSIDMVLRFSGEEINPEQPESVLAGINRPVVYYNPSLDITKLVLDELNRTAINPGAADRRGTTAPRPTVPFNNNRQ